jgi:hypothetical protein
LERAFRRIWLKDLLRTGRSRQAVEFAPPGLNVFPSSISLLFSGHDVPHLPGDAKFMRKPFAPIDLIGAVRAGT